MEISTDPSSASSSTAVRRVSKKAAPRKVISDKYRGTLTPAKRLLINERKRAYMRRIRASRNIANTEFLDVHDDDADVVNAVLGLVDADDDADVQR